VGPQTHVQVSWRATSQSASLVLPQHAQIRRVPGTPASHPNKPTAGLLGTPASARFFAACRPGFATGISREKDGRSTPGGDIKVTSTPELL
jgi:hypothetical protein